MACGATFYFDSLLGNCQPCSKFCKYPPEECVQYCTPSTAPPTTPDPTVVPLVISAAILIFVFLLALVLLIVLYYSRRRACHHPEKPMALSPTNPTEKPDGAVTRLVVPTKTLSRSITRECQALQPENVGLGGSNVVVRAV